jgi:hypothetical protein
LSAQLEKDVADVEERLVAVARLSFKDLTNEMSQSTAKGGRMRVKTGFLRASGKASLTGMPSGPLRGDPEQSYNYDEGAGVDLTVGRFKLGMTLYWGWTAAYAQFREVYDGFMEGAIRHWPRIVAINTDTVRRKFDSAKR